MERAIVLGVLAVWGIASLATLAYQQVNLDQAENVSAETRR